MGDQTPRGEPGIAPDYPGLAIDNALTKTDNSNDEGHLNTHESAEMTP